MSNWNSGRAQESHSVFGWSETLTPAATNAASAVEQAFTTTSVPQGQPLKATDQISVTGPGSGNNVAIGGVRVNTSGQIVIQFINPTAGSLTHASGVFVFKVSRL